MSVLCVVAVVVDVVVLVVLVVLLVHVLVFWLCLFNSCACVLVVLVPVLVF